MESDDRKTEDANMTGKEAPTMRYLPIALPGILLRGFCDPRATFGIAGSLAPIFPTWPLDTGEDELA